MARRMRFRRTLDGRAISMYWLAIQTVPQVRMAKQQERREIPDGIMSAVSRLRLFATAASLAAVLTVTHELAAAPRPPAFDESDRLAFQTWFTLLADAQFERPTADVIDCASLVRHAYREALRAHTPEWFRRARLPLTVSVPDV